MAVVKTPVAPSTSVIVDAKLAEEVRCVSGCGPAVYEVGCSN